MSIRLCFFHAIFSQVPYTGKLYIKQQVQVGSSVLDSYTQERAETSVLSTMLQVSGKSEVCGLITATRQCLPNAKSIINSIRANLGDQCFFCRPNVNPGRLSRTTGFDLKPLPSPREDHITSCTGIKGYFRRGTGSQISAIFIAVSGEIGFDAFYNAYPPGYKAMKQVEIN